MNKPRRSLISFNLIMLVVTIGFGVATLYQDYHNNKKSLTFDLVDSRWLAKNMSDSTGKIAIYYNGKQVADDVLITTISFINEGSIPITPEDFIEPIRIKYTSDSKILDIINVTSTSNANNISAKYSYNNNQLIISPTLINPGDIISFNIISDGISVKAQEMQYRIKGISNIKPKTSLSENSLRFNYYKFAIFFFCLTGTSLLMSFVWYCILNNIQIIGIVEQTIIASTSVAATLLAFDDFVSGLGWKPNLWISTSAYLFLVAIFSFILFKIKERPFRE